MLDLIQKFRAAVDAGTLTQAAEDLYITQPALTQAIKKLERIFGTDLLVRGRMGVIPTPAGLIVYEHSKKLNLLIADLVQEVANAREETGLVIRMGMIDNFGLNYAEKIYSIFGSQFASCNLEVEVQESRRLIQRVQDGDLDFAIISKPLKPISEDVFSISDFVSETLCLIATPQIARQITELRDIEAFSFISYNKDSTTHQIISNTLKGHGVNLKVSINSSNPFVILMLVKMGIGVGVLPRSMVGEDLDKRVLREIKIGDIAFRRQLSLIWLRARYLSPVKRQFIQTVRAISPQL